MRYGELTEAEAAVHPHRHILTRALGVAAEVEIDLWELHLRTGDRSAALQRRTHQRGRRRADRPSPRRGPRSRGGGSTLVDWPTSTAGNDNITVVVIDVLVGDDEGRPVTSVFHADRTPAPGCPRVPRARSAGRCGCGAVLPVRSPARRRRAVAVRSPTSPVPTGHRAPALVDPGTVSGPDTQAVPVLRPIASPPAGVRRRCGSVPARPRSSAQRERPVGARRRRLGVPAPDHLPGGRFFILLVAAIVVAALLRASAGTPPTTGS